MYGAEFSSSVSNISLRKIPPLAFLSLTNQSAHTKEFLLDLHYIQARQSISQIEDPLWKNICSELIKVMGALSVLKIWESRLGGFSAQSSHIEIHCKNEDVAQFMQQYAFVILASLQYYFPSVKNLEIKVS